MGGTNEFIEIAAAGKSAEANNDNARTNVQIIAPAAPLNVELGKFGAYPKKEQKAILLAWEVLSETNNAGFELQRTSNLEGDFKKIQWIPSLGNTENLRQYNFLDQSVNVNTTYYYRFKQIDLDGKETFSRVAEARIDDPIRMDAVLFPNPVNEDLLNVEIFSAMKGVVTFSIYNALGQKVSQERKNLNNIKNPIQLNVKDLPQGFYALEITNQLLRITRNFVVN